MAPWQKKGKRCGPPYGRGSSGAAYDSKGRRVAPPDAQVSRVASMPVIMFGLAEAGQEVATRRKNKQYVDGR